MNKKLIDEIQYIDDIELDILWTLLKRRDLRIGRKLVCMGHLLDIKEEVILREARTDEDGRILDKANRLDIHEALLDFENESN